MFGKSRKSTSKTSSAIRPCIEGLEARQLLSASPTVWADDAAGKLFTVNVGTGQTHVIGQMPADMFDIAFSPTGSLYGVDEQSNLWKINPNNASATQVGALGAGVNSLVFSSSGTLYAAGYRLYTVSTSTGHATAVGTSFLSGFSSAGDLAFDASGNLYLSTNSNDLVRVNTTTGAATKIGAMGFQDVYGMAYGPDHVMYGMSDQTDQIFSINLSTGHGTLLSSFANQGVFGVNGSTFIGEAVAPKAIEVDGGGLKIADGDTTPSTSDGTDFGSAIVNSGSVVHTFVIKNNTSATLHLTGTPRVQISGLDAGDFTVVTLPASSVAPGGSTSFQVKFAPHGTGTRTATVTIFNSDPHDGAYHFAVRGNGAVKPTGTVIYACDSQGELFTVSSATGVTHVIGRMSTVMYDIAFNAGGALYGIDNSDDIYRINPANAATTFVGSLNVADNINSLTFAANGQLYAAGQDLYRIDLSAGKYYDIGYLGGYTSAGDLAFDKSGRLVMSTTTNQLVVVNPNTAQTSLIGNIGFTDVLGLAEGSDGNLYGMSNTIDQIFSINPITGHGTSAVHFSGVYGVYGAAVKPA